MPMIFHAEGASTSLLRRAQRLLSAAATTPHDGHAASPLMQMPDHETPPPVVQRFRRPSRFFRRMPVLLHYSALC